MLPPIRKTVTVPWDQDAAFRRFTAEIGAWWPLRTHSVGQARAETVTFDGRVGGRIVEKIRGGEDAEWGTVTAWEPPRRVAFTWHPGGQPAEATTIDVAFEPVAGGTRLVLVHAHWEALGAAAKIARRGYPIGWTYVLAHWANRRYHPGVLALGAVQRLLMLVGGALAARSRRRQARASGGGGASAA